MVHNMADYFFKAYVTADSGEGTGGKYPLSISLPLNMLIQVQSRTKEKERKIESEA